MALDEDEQHSDTDENPAQHLTRSHSRTRVLRGTSHFVSISPDFDSILIFTGEFLAMSPSSSNALSPASPTTPQILSSNMGFSSRYSLKDAMPTISPIPPL